MNTFKKFLKYITGFSDNDEITIIIAGEEQTDVHITLKLVEEGKFRDLKQFTSEDFKATKKALDKYLEHLDI